VSLAAAVVMVAIAEPLLVAVYGEDFRPGASALRILAVAIIPFGLSSIITGYLGASGTPRWSVAVWAWAALASIGANLAVVDRYGIGGAAVISLITYSGVAAVLFVRAKPPDESGEAT
jgi:O-antigen/teichoic acid export membrane protein